MHLREPGTTKVGEKIREILLDNTTKNLYAETELLLYSAARAQLVREKIEPELSKGKVVVLDRFYDSTFAYQGFGRGLSLEFIEQMTNFVVEKTVPDITFYLAITLQQMQERKIAGGEKADRLEESPLPFFEKVIEGYNVLSLQDSHRFIRIDANQKREELASQIWQKLVAKGITDFAKPEA